MEKLFKLLIITLMLFSFVGCGEEESSGNNSSSSNTENDDGGQSFSDDDEGTPNTGGGNCAGTTADGQGAGTPLHQFNLFLAGHQSWVPGTYTDPLAQQTMINIQEASLLFRSDSKLQVRFKVKTQPFPTAGEEYCFGRQTGAASDQFNYTKLRFRVHLRDILCDQPDPQNPNNCLSGFYLGDRYQSQFVDPIGVDSCSNILDLGSLRNATAYGTTVEVEDVKSDSTCQLNETFCPAEKIVRRASCWHMTMQVSTDFTQSFKN